MAQKSSRYTYTWNISVYFSIISFFHSHVTYSILLFYHGTFTIAISRVHMTFTWSLLVFPPSLDPHLLLRVCNLPCVFDQSNTCEATKCGTSYSLQRGMVARLINMSSVTHDLESWKAGWNMGSTYPSVLILGCLLLGSPLEIPCRLP